MRVTYPSRLDYSRTELKGVQSHLFSNWVCDSAPQDSIDVSIKPAIVCMEVARNAAQSLRSKSPTCWVAWLTVRRQRMAVEGSAETHPSLGLGGIVDPTQPFRCTNYNAPGLILANSIHLRPTIHAD